jgi:predicted nucleic acid-binding protein
LIVARIVVLDAGPLGLASQARGKPDADRCRVWIDALEAAGVRVVAPEIADYEVRRELLRAGATAGVRRLDRLIGSLDYAPITTAAMRRAAEFWAIVRRGGVPTAHPHALDADCILAGQATLLGGSGDAVTIASANIRHLARFPGIDAREWEQIAP